MVQLYIIVTTFHRKIQRRVEMGLLKARKMVQFMIQLNWKKMETPKHRMLSVGSLITLIIKTHKFRFRLIPNNMMMRDYPLVTTLKED